MNDLARLTAEKNKPQEERNEFLFDLHANPPDFFGSSVEKRQKLCCSIHNYCVFNHTVDECRCHEGVDPWRKSTVGKPCLFHHDPASCKCDRVAMAIGQDESVFHAYILGG